MRIDEGAVTVSKQTPAPVKPVPFVSPEITNQQPVGAYTEAPPDPPGPSILSRIASIGNAIISPFINLGEVGIKALESEIQQLISKLTDFVKTNFADAYSYIEAGFTAARNDVGKLIKGAKDEAHTIGSDVHNYAAHLFDSLTAKLDALASKLSGDVASLEHQTLADIKEAVKQFEPGVRQLIDEVTKPVESFVNNADSWFEAHWKQYTGDLESWVNNSDHWFEAHWKASIRGTEDFFNGPVRWFEDNWKRLAGDVLQWVEPAPLRFLGVLPQILGWVEWLASNPLDWIFAIGRAAITPANYEKANAQLKLNKYIYASKAVERFRQSQ